MNSRRLIASPEAQDKASYRLNLARWKGASDNRADSANSGHRKPHSMTSSARASSVGGTVM
ncbi:MAG: hypothetical protein WB005_09180, partial [Pseudolabrys sp.]